MGTLSKLTSGGQITLPKEIRKKVNIQAGDYIEIKLEKNGQITLLPKKLVDASQAYFWTEEWQKGERKADEDIKAGRLKRFKSAAEAIKYLEAKE
jgi:AbrB family looped-hinge helix DNA binding protein